MMKKFLAVLLCGTMLAGTLCLAGCGGSDDKSDESAKTEDAGDEGSAEGGSNLEESKALLEEAIATLKTTDNQDMMAAGNPADVPEAVGTPEELEAPKAEAPKTTKSAGTRKASAAKKTAAGKKTTAKKTGTKKTAAGAKKSGSKKEPGV